MSFHALEEKYRNLPGEIAEKLYEHAPCGYLSFVGDGTIVMINHTLLSWLGCEKEEILFRKKFQQLLSIGGRIYFETHFFPLLRMQGFVKEINLDFKRKGKGALPTLLNVNEVAVGQGEEKIYQATLFDITDRKKYEKELLEARRKADIAVQKKAEFLATISHEIRTPLNAIIGIANLLHNTPLNEQQAEYARILKHSSDGLLGLLNNILDFSKIEKGRVKLEEKIFSVKEVALGITQLYQSRAGEKGIHLRLHLDERVPDYLLGDPMKLNQVLTNLIGNAIKFTSTGYVALQVQVLEQLEEQVSFCFKVTDTGIGISEDRLEAIFEEFSQASYDVNLNYGGTGLGLTISQKLLQLHGSKIDVVSELGKGSEFGFVLKYKISSKPPAVEVTAYVDKRKLNTARVLIVDDTPLNLTIVKEYMKHWEIPCDAASSGRQAIELVQSTTYDLVLMDLQMPEMNGFQATRAIRQLSLAKQPAVVALSASARGDISEKLKLSGFNDYLSKPFNPTDLYKLILQHISISEQEEGVGEEVVPQELGVTGVGAEASDAGTAVSPSFDLSYFVQLTNESGGSMQEVIGVTIRSFENLEKQSLAAVAERDAAAFADFVHKSKMPLHYIQARDLGKIVEGMRQLLEQHDTDVRQLEEKSRELKAGFEKVISGLRSCLVTSSPIKDR